MKLALIFVCVAVALPSITQAFLFGVTLTDAAGLTLAAANPAQTGVIITVGVLGAALAFAAGSLIGQLPLFEEEEVVGVHETSYGPYRRRTSLLHKGLNRLASLRRGKREVQQKNIDGLFDTIFADIQKSNVEGCFERLVCDIAARPTKYQKHASIVKGIEMMESHAMTGEASTVSRKLLSAVRFGKNTSDMVACEVTFNKCHWSGPQMNQVMEKFDKSVTIKP